MVLLTLSDKFSTIRCKYRHWNCTILLLSVHLSSVFSNLILFTSQKKMLVHSSWRLTNLCLLFKILEMSVCGIRQQSKKIRILHRMGFLLYNQASGSDYSKIQHQRRNKSTIKFFPCFPDILNHPQNPCIDL